MRILKNTTKNCVINTYFGRRAPHVDHSFSAMLVALPFIYEYPIKVQLSILLFFLVISYVNRRARIAIGSLAGAYLGFKILVPVMGWAFFLFKGVAWFGFYIYFFQKAVRYAITSFDYIFGDGLESLIRELDKHGR